MAVSFQSQHLTTQATICMAARKPVKFWLTFCRYLYGGQDPIEAKIYDDVYILTLPTFRWIKLFQGDSPRFGHTCHLVGSRQLLTVGGIDNFNTTKKCDWEAKSVAILDLSSKTWGSVYNANAPPYTVTQE